VNSLTVLTSVEATSSCRWRLLHIDWQAMKARIGLLVLVVACCQSPLGCSRVAEVNAIVSYRPGVTSMEQVKTLPLGHVLELQAAVPRGSNDHEFYLGLGWISIRNATQHDWMGVGVILAGPNLKSAVEPYVRAVHTDDRGDVAQVLYGDNAPVEFRCACDRIKAGETAVLHLSRFSPAATVSRLVSVSQDPMATADRLRASQVLPQAVPGGEELWTQLVGDIVASRANVRVVVGIGTSATEKNAFLRDNAVGSKRPVMLPIAGE